MGFAGPSKDEGEDLFTVEKDAQSVVVVVVGGGGGGGVWYVCYGRKGRGFRAENGGPKSSVSDSWKGFDPLKVCFN